MKGFFLVLYVLSSAHAFGQADSLITAFFKDILKRDATGMIVYTKQEGQTYQGPNMTLKKNAERVAGPVKETLSLTGKEYAYLQSQWKKNKGFVWPDSLVAHSLRIEVDSVLSYLRKDYKRIVYQFSSPIFIRKHTVALIHIVTLCCGHIYGSDHLLYYKKLNNVWTAWRYMRESYY